MATAFPFDPSGMSAANRVTNEQHVITAQNFRDYHYVIPKFAPFFEKDFTIKMQYPNGNVRNLTLGVDYYFSNQFLDASRACAKPIYGSISFLDTDTAGILSISYNTVGGMWNITLQEISRILAEEMRNPRITTWEQITYLPERFPVIDHEWDLVDMVGASELVKSIDLVRDAILTSSGGGLSQHVNNYSNPHNVTKLQVGLGNVQDYAVASVAQAQAGTSNAFYMTPLRTKDAINSLGAALVNAHANRTDNPHSVTKAQVGLGNVPNYAGATQTEATAGAIDTALMTPLRTAQAITAQVGTAFANHIANQLNPHNVTKDQVGLFNVQNFAVATQEEAIAGTASDRYMTPLRTTQLVREFVTMQLDGHATRTDNPHQTTKSQIGLGNVENYPIATVTQAQVGSSNTTYMTPGRTLDAINALATPKSHASNMNNPHQVTADQVGAYTTVQIDAKLSDYVAKTDNWVAGQTKQDFIAGIQAGTVNNAMKLDGRTLPELLMEAAEGFDNEYARTTSRRSRHSDTTISPVTRPNRWILIGSVFPLIEPLPDETETIAVTYPDAFWFFSGGHKHLEDPAANSATVSPGYLIRAHNGGAAVANKVDVTRLSGSADSDISIGYTYDAVADRMDVWAKVHHGYNDLSAVRLTSLANANDMSTDNVDVEPVGITYVTPVSYVTATTFSALGNRVTALEDVINSILVV